MHFAAFQTQRDALQRDDGAEVLADVFEREDHVVVQASAVAVTYRVGHGRLRVRLATRRRM